MRHVLLEALTALVVMAAGAVTGGGALTVTDAWIPETPPGVRVAAGYLTVTNGGKTPVSLQGVESPDYRQVEMHRTVMHDGLADMEEVRSLPVPPRGRLVFARGGNHFMLYDPKRVFHVGDTVRLVLVFSDKRRLAVTVPVRDGSSVYRQ
jgi:copper(I)-binding protein